MSRKDQPKPKKPPPRDVVAAAITRLDARVDRLDTLVSVMAGQLERLNAAEIARALEGARRRRAQAPRPHPRPLGRRRRPGARGGAPGLPGGLR